MQKSFTQAVPTSSTLQTHNPAICVLREFLPVGCFCHLTLHVTALLGDLHWKLSPDRIATPGLFPAILSSGTNLEDVLIPFLMNNKDFYSLGGSGDTHSLQKSNSWGTSEKKNTLYIQIFVLIYQDLEQSSPLLWGHLNQENIGERKNHTETVSFF